MATANILVELLLVAPNMGLALCVWQIIFWFGFVFGFWFYNDRDSYTGKCLNFESKTKRTSGVFL